MRSPDSIVSNKAVSETRYRVRIAESIVSDDGLLVDVSDPALHITDRL